MAIFVRRDFRCCLRRAAAYVAGDLAESASAATAIHPGLTTVEPESRDVLTCTARGDTIHGEVTYARLYQPHSAPAARRRRRGHRGRPPRAKRSPGSGAVAQ